MREAMQVARTAPRVLLTEGWKKDLALALKSLGLVDERYTGRIVLTISRGTIAEVERSERLR